MRPDVDAGSLEEAYLEWLYGQIGAVSNHNPARSHWNLIRQFHSREFTWFVFNDENRVEDGKELRMEFLSSLDVDILEPFHAFLIRGCSFLEMLIAIAKRASTVTEDDALSWFWQLVHNLELDRYTDNIFEISISEEVDETMTSVVNRTYSPDGVGGLFPLRRPQSDQRRIELWYQMSAYILEKEPIEDDYLY